MANDKRTAEQIEALGTMHRLADTVLDAAQELCVLHSDDDDIYYIPFVIVVAAKDGSPISSTVHFGQQHLKNVAHILRMSADHIEGKVHHRSRPQ